MSSTCEGLKQRAEDLQEGEGEEEGESKTRGGTQRTHFNKDCIGGDESKQPQRQHRNERQIKLFSAHRHRHETQGADRKIETPTNNQLRSPEQQREKTDETSLYGALKIGSMCITRCVRVIQVFLLTCVPSPQDSVLKFLGERSSSFDLEENYQKRCTESLNREWSRISTKRKFFLLRK